MSDEATRTPGAESAVIRGVGNHPRIAEHGIDHRIIGRLVALGWHESNPDITTSPRLEASGSFDLIPARGTFDVGSPINPVGKNPIDADE